MGRTKKEQAEEKKNKKKKKGKSTEKERDGALLETAAAAPRPTLTEVLDANTAYLGSATRTNRVLLKIRAFGRTLARPLYACCHSCEEYERTDDTDGAQYTVV